jgi:predicted nucleic acid-binding protein
MARKIKMPKRHTATSPAEGVITTVLHRTPRIQRRAIIDASVLEVLMERRNPALRDFVLDATPLCVSAFTLFKVQHQLLRNNADTDPRIGFEAASTLARNFSFHRLPLYESAANEAARIAHAVDGTGIAMEVEMLVVAAQARDYALAVLTLQPEAYQGLDLEVLSAKHTMDVPLFN